MEVGAWPQGGAAEGLAVACGSRCTPRFKVSGTASGSDAHADAHSLRSMHLNELTHLRG